MSPLPKGFTHLTLELPFWDLIPRTSTRLSERPHGMWAIPPVAWSVYTVGFVLPTTFSTGLHTFQIPSNAYARKADSPSGLRAEI